MSKNELVDNLENFNFNLTPRPLPGTKGRPQNIMVNCYDINFKVKFIHHYTVEFHPSLDQKSDENRRRILFKSFGDQLYATFGKSIFFDNIQLYSLYKPDSANGKIIFEDDSTGRQVIFTHENKFDMTKLKTFEMATQILHFMLRRVIRDVGYTKTGRKYFKDIRRNSVTVSEKNLEPVCIWKGFFVSMELVKRGFVIKVDPAQRIVYKRNMRDLIEEERRVYGGTDFAGHISRKYEGLCVITSYSRRVYRLAAFDDDVTPQNKFYCDRTKGEISFEKYVVDNYGVRPLAHPHSKGMLVNVNQKGNQKGNKIMLLPELCFLTGMDRKMKENLSFMRRIARETSSLPQERFFKMREFMKSLEHKIAQINSLGEEVHEVGEDISRALEREKLPFQVSRKEVVVPSRVLPGVKVDIKKLNRAKRAADAVVSAIPGLKRDWVESKFIHGAKVSPKRIRRWAIVAEKNNERLAKSLKTQMADIGKTIDIWGKELSVDPEMVIFSANRNSYRYNWTNAIEKFIVKQERMQKGLEFLVVVLPRHPLSELIYTDIKNLCNVAMGIPTQCIRTQNLESRKSYQAIKGVLKQIMAKVNNRLWAVRFEQLSPQITSALGKFTIVIGIDVCHDWKASKSTVGICVSYDNKFTRYWSYVTKQKKTQEIVSNFTSIMTRVFVRFKKLYKHNVENIIVYRDGVSSSQIETVVDKEVQQILQAARSLRAAKEEFASFAPKLTFIVVQKNVSLRMVTKDFRSVAPGTVVDEQIVSRNFWDFYLVPHEPPPTSKFKAAVPTRFIVVYDEIQFCSDDIQMFSNYLCTNYFNYPGPIKIPAPIKYADKLAFLFNLFKGTKPHKSVQNTLFML